MNWKLATLKLAALATLATFANSAFAGNAVNPDAIELAPLPMPVEFKSDMDAPVPFDRNTVVTVDCPDKSAVQWLASHFAGWYGADAPKVKGGKSELSYENKSQVGKIALAISAFRTEVPDLCRSPIRSEGRQASLHSIIRLAGVPPR